MLRVIGNIGLNRVTTECRELRKMEVIRKVKLERERKIKVGV